MKLYVKNKLISLSGNSDVLNENKEPVYRVEGKLISPTRVKRLVDLNGELIYKIRNKWWSFFVKKAYIYNKENEKIAKISKKFFSLKPKFIIEGYKDEIKIEGGWFTGKLDITKNGEIVGSIKREFTFFSDDCFCLEAEEENITFLVALVVAIDNIYDEKEKERR